MWEIVLGWIWIEQILKIKLIYLWIMVFIWFYDYKNKDLILKSSLMALNCFEQLEIFCSNIKGNYSSWQEIRGCVFCIDVNSSIYIFSEHIQYFKKINHSFWILCLQSSFKCPHRWAQTQQCKHLILSCFFLKKMRGTQGKVCLFLSMKQGH